MTAQQMVDGLNIIAKYCELGLEGLEVHGAHDEVTVDSAYMAGRRVELKKTTEFSEKDKKELEELGWHPCTSYGGDTMWRHF